nr:uncharacterized protein LOC111427430 [Onthophagus taurus]
MSLVPYDIDSSDSEFDNNSQLKLKKKKTSQPVRIIIENPSSSEDEDDSSRHRNETRKSNTRNDLFAILPSPKSKRTSLILPRVLQMKTAGSPIYPEKPPSADFKEKRAKKNRKRAPDIQGYQGASGDFRNIPEGTFCTDNGQVVNCAPDVRDPVVLRNSDFRELLNTGKSPTVLMNIEGADLFEYRNRVKALTDPEQVVQLTLDQAVNRTCKKKNHINYLLQMAKTNELSLKNKWSLNKYTRQQTKAKYGF